MPPITPVAVSSIATYDGNSFFFTVPTTARPGDALFAVVVIDQIAAQLKNVDSLAIANGWTQVVRLQGASFVAFVLAQTLAASAGPQVAAGFDLSVSTRGAGVLLVYRGPNMPAAAGTGAIVNVVTSTSWPCPSLTPASYSDMYLGIVFVAAAASLTPPAGAVERCDLASTFVSTSTIEVFDLITENTVATGTKIATSGVAQSGIAAAVLIPAGAPPGPGKVIVIDPPGSIGLPRVGV